MSRIGNLQDFLEAVGPYQPVGAGTSAPEAPTAPEAPDLPVVPGELLLEAEPDGSPPLQIATGFGAGAADEPVDLDAVTAVTRFPPRR